MADDEHAALSKHRLQRAKDDFESSKLLFENNKLAQSINRSYYSIFHATRDIKRGHTRNITEHSEDTEKRQATVT